MLLNKASVALFAASYADDLDSDAQDQIDGANKLFNVAAKLRGLDVGNDSTDRAPDSESSLKKRRTTFANVMAGKVAKPDISASKRYSLVAKLREDDDKKLVAKERKASVF